MKQFLSSDKGAISLIGLILLVMWIAASTGQDVRGASEPTPVPPKTAEETAAPEIPTDTPAPAVLYTTQDLNLRAGPGADQEKVTVLQQGTQVELLGESQSIDGGTWVHVRAAGYEGWVNRKFLSE